MEAIEYGYKIQNRTNSDRYPTIFPSGDWQANLFAQNRFCFLNCLNPRRQFVLATFKIIKPLSGRLIAEDAIP